MILCLFFFSSLKHSEHQWTPGFVPFFSSPHLMFFFLPSDKGAILVMPTTFFPFSF